MTGREIKFRYVYNCDECGKITTDEYTLQDIEEFYEDFECVTEIKCSCGYAAGRIARVQFTGLKDKNGVEIYEGDIVRYGGADFEVFAGRGGFGLQEMESMAYLMHGDMWITALMRTFDTVETCEMLEIIGNIYESKGVE